MNINEKKVLLVDDDAPLLKMMGVLLDKEGFINVCKASCGENAIEIVEKWQPDLIVLDIMMPDIDGYEVCKKIRSSSMVPILFLSAKNEEMDKLKAFSLGGDDFINKPFSNKELVARIRAKLNRDAYYEKKGNGNVDEKRLVKFGVFCLDLDRRQLYRENETVELSLKEYLLLEYLVINQNITLSKEQIVQNVWNDCYDGYDNTIAVHIRHLREKIEDSSSKPIYIKTVKGIGYRFELAENK